MSELEAFSLKERPHPEKPAERLGNDSKALRLSGLGQKTGLLFTDPAQSRATLALVDSSPRTHLVRLATS
jgi:hypothetical protein